MVKSKKNNYTNDIKYKEAEKLYKNNNYLEAYNIYIELVKKYGKVSKLYKRLIECLTHNYTYKDRSKNFKKCYNEYLTTYRLIATKGELRIFNKKQEEYKNLKCKSESKFILILFLGIFGVHKFIEKKYILGIIYLFTLGLFGLGVIYDLIMDYATYEDDFGLDILRCLISIIIVLIGIIFYKGVNIIFFIIVGILLTPLIYSKLLGKVPNIIKIIIIIILLYFGFRENITIESVPTNLVGNWVTTNENTNLKEIDIKFSKTKIKFKDRKSITGNNVYKSEDNILTVTKSVTEYYKFKYDKKNKRICLYNENNSCLIYFKK